MINPNEKSVDPPEFYYNANELRTLDVPKTNYIENLK